MIFAKLYRRFQTVLCALCCCGLLHTVLASDLALNLDAALREIDSPPTSLSPTMPLNTLLAGVANKIYLAEKRSAIDNRIAYLKADQERIRSQMLEQQELAQAEASYEARERAERERQRQEPQTNWFAKAIAIGGMAAVISQAEGVSSELAMEMMVQYSAGVLTDQDPVELSADLEKIAQKHIQFQAAQIKQLQIARAQLEEQATREQTAANNVNRPAANNPPRRVRDADVPPARPTGSQQNSQIAQSASPSQNTNTSDTRVSFSEAGTAPPIPGAEAEMATPPSEAPTPTMASTQTRSADFASSAPPQSIRVLKANDFCPDIEEHIFPRDFAGPIANAWSKFKPGDRTVGAVAWSESGRCADKAALIAQARAMLMNMDGQKRIWAPNPNGENSLRLWGNGVGERLCPLPEKFSELAKSRRIEIQTQTISCSFIGSQKLSRLEAPEKAEDFDYWGICSAMYSVEPC